MIWHRFTILRPLFASRKAAVEVARRWRAASARDAALQHDLIRMGGLLFLQPVDLDQGMATLAPIDPHRLAYEAGRRDLAVQLLALMGLTIPEMNTLMEDDDE